MIKGSRIDRASAAEKAGVKKFADEVVKAINAGKPFPPAVDLGDRIIEWQLRITEDIFIERGKETKSALAEYIAVMERKKTGIRHFRLKINSR